MPSSGRCALFLSWVFVYVCVLFARIGPAHWPDVIRRSEVGVCANVFPSSAYLFLRFHMIPRIMFTTRISHILLRRVSISQVLVTCAAQRKQVRANNPMWIRLCSIPLTRKRLRTLAPAFSDPRRVFLAGSLSNCLAVPKGGRQVGRDSCTETTC